MTFLTKNTASVKEEADAILKVYANGVPGHYLYPKLKQKTPFMEK